jgi:hypothetical protein
MQQSSENLVEEIREIIYNHPVLTVSKKEEISKILTKAKDFYEQSLNDFDEICRSYAQDKNRENKKKLLERMEVVLLIRDKIQDIRDVLQKKGSYNRIKAFSEGLTD